MPRESLRNSQGRAIDDVQIARVARQVVAQPLHLDHHHDAVIFHGRRHQQPVARHVAADPVDHRLHGRPQPLQVEPADLGRNRGLHVDARLGRIEVQNHLGAGAAGKIAQPFLGGLDVFVEVDPRGRARAAGSDAGNDFDVFHLRLRPADDVCQRDRRLPPQLIMLTLGASRHCSRLAAGTHIFPRRAGVRSITRLPSFSSSGQCRL